jgi:predicted DNA-binding antitoxin AbrB/MazE fold protein
MNETTRAIYENGVLWLLEPLDLPEHTRVRVSVQPERNIDELPPVERREALRAILRAAGLVAEREQVPPTAHLLSEEEREELGRRFAGDPPLSQIIIEERDGR